MTQASQTELTTRANIMKLLSDGELSSISSAETETHLRRGDEYLDLEHLQQGVLKADGSTPRIPHALPRKAIHEDTWRRVLRALMAARR